MPLAPAQNAAQEAQEMAAPTITRTPFVDDDGTGTTGTVINNPWKQELYDQIDAVIASEDAVVATVPHGGTGVATLAAHGVLVGNAAAAVNVTGAGSAGQVLTSNGASADPTFQANAALPGVSTVTTTGNITALPLPTGSGNLVIYMNNATLATIQGIAAGLSGQRLSIVSVGAGQVDCAHQNAGATAANRLINIATSGNTPLAAGTGSADFMYDATNSRWRLVTHEQGAWITPATPTFSGNGSMTWTTVTVNLNRYKLRGRDLTIQFDFNGTAGGTPNTLLQFTLANGFTAAANYAGVYDGNLLAAALWSTTSGLNTFGFYKDLTAGANWAAGAARVIGNATFEVQ
jgi:hypothetical protein